MQSPYREYDFDLLSKKGPRSFEVLLGIQADPLQLEEVEAFLLQVKGFISITEHPDEQWNFQFQVRTDTILELTRWCTEHLSDCDGIIAYTGLEPVKLMGRRPGRGRPTTF